MFVCLFNGLFGEDSRGVPEYGIWNSTTIPALCLARCALCFPWPWNRFGCCAQSVAPADYVTTFGIDEVNGQLPGSFTACYLQNEAPSDAPTAPPRTERTGGRAIINLRKIATRKAAGTSNKSFTRTRTAGKHLFQSPPTVNGPELGACASPYATRLVHRQVYDRGRGMGHERSTQRSPNRQPECRIGSIFWGVSELLQRVNTRGMHRLHRRAAAMSLWQERLLPGLDHCGDRHASDRAVCPAGVRA